MPNFDRTGPNGSGKLTGRGLGLCNSDSENISQGRGLGIAFRSGSGRGRGFGRGQRCRNFWGIQKLDNTDEVESSK